MGKRGRRWVLSLAVAMSLGALGVWAAPASMALPVPTLNAPTVLPNSVPAGGTVTVMGTGCPQIGSSPLNVEVEILNGTHAIAVGSVPGTQITSGTWSAQLTIPITAGPGTYTVASTCDNYYSALGTNYPPAQVTVLAPLVTPPPPPPALPKPTVTPDTVLAGASVTVSGVGCLPHGTTPLNVEVSILNGTTPIASGGVPATAGGTWSVQLTVPGTAGPGTYTVASTCDNYYSALGTNYPAAQVTVQAPLVAAPPAVTVNPNVVQVGGSTDVTGVNFGANEQVNVELHSNPVLLATFTSNASGLVRGTVTVPAGTALGDHEVQLVGLSTGVSASAPLTVVAAPATGTASSSSTQLASTGTNSSLMVDGLIMLVVGLAVMLFTWQWTLTVERATISRRKQQMERPTTKQIRWEY